MNSIIKNILCLIGIGAVLLFTGCNKSIEPEMTSLNLGRLLSPTGVSALVIDGNTASVSWNKVSKATAYQVEVYDNAGMTGTPVKTYPDISKDVLTYTITGLEGETDYYVRIKATGTETDDSKWTTVTFKTRPEQIMKTVDLSEIKATEVILRWTPGANATRITLSPGNISHNVTPSEIAAGAATITGLAPETAYTATLFNGTKTRGYTTFSTPLDLGGAIQVNPGDDLTSILQNANSGDVFALMPGEYNTQDITITKSISIKGARPANKPVLKGTILRIVANAGLQLKDLVLDGTGSKDGNQAIIYDEDLNTAYAAFKMEDCMVRNYTKGLIYINKKTWIQSVLFKGNIIYDIECNGGDFIDFRNGLATVFDFTNNTVYNSALARDFFRMDAGGSTNFPAVKSIITINNNTFYKVSDGNNRRMLYIRLAAHEITFNKNILAATLGYYTNQGATTIKEMSKNNYFNAPNFTGSTTSGAKNDTGDYTQLDPGFTSPSTGNFTISNVNLKAAGIGDPRWIN
ncbi:DUF4957 domain-containing protein [Niabella aquatica]